MPTFSPAISLVPRWRTRTAPASTTLPAYSFTPSRCPAESRPLRVEPAPFLWAIPLCLDLRDADGRRLGAMAGALARAGLVLVPEDDDLLALPVTHDLARDLRLRRVLHALAVR